MKSIVSLKNINPFLIWIFFLGFAGEAVRNSVGWVWYGGIVVLTVILFAVHVLRTKNLHTVQVSKFVWAFLTALIISTITSTYFLWSLLGVAITIITLTTAWLIGRKYDIQQIVYNLWVTIFSIVLISFIVELVVATIGTPLLPVYIKPAEHLPNSYYWVLGDLFTGGPLQGIVGNRNLFGFLGLLLLILTFFVKNVSFGWKLVAAFSAVATILLTRSATVTVALIGCVVVYGTVWVIRTWQTKYERTKYVVLTFFTGAGVTAITLLYHPIMGLLHRSPDMTSRFTIWGNVWELVVQKPLTGWGWLGHWVPTIPPFNTLAVFKGTAFLHAHNAYLDVLFQTGILGFTVFLGLIIVTGYRVWKIAVDNSTPYSVLPLILLVALLVQAVTESRLLLEGNLLLLFLLSIIAKTTAGDFMKLLHKLPHDKKDMVIFREDENRNF